MLLLKSDRQLSTLMSNRSSLHGGRTASAVIPEENDIAQHRRESALLTQFRIAHINVRNTIVCLFIFFVIIWIQIGFQLNVMKGSCELEDVSGLDISCNSPI